MIINKYNISHIIDARRLDPIFFRYDTKRFGTIYPLVSIGSCVVDMQSGIGAGKEEQADEKTGVIHIRPTNIDKEGSLIYVRNVYVPANANIPTLSVDDVLFNNTNSQELVGKTAILKENRQLMFSNHITRIRVNKNCIIPEYLWIILNIYQQERIFFSICTNWNNQSGVGIDLLKSVKIPLPPIDIQQQIVDIYTTAQKAKQAKEEQANTLLDSIDDYLLSQLGIILPAKEATQKIYKVKLSDLLGSRLNPAIYNPNTIALKSIQQSNALPKMHLADMIISNIAGDWGKDESEIADNYTRCLVIRATEFDNKYNLNLDNSRTKYRQIKTDKLNKMDVRTCDILIEKSGGSPDQPVGRVAYITDEIVKDNNTVAYSNFIQKIRIDQTKANSEYVYYYLRTMYRIGITESMQSQTNGIRNLQMNNYFQQTVLLPDNQNEIVKHIRAIYAQAKALEDEAVVVLESAKKQIEKMILR